MSSHWRTALAEDGHKLRTELASYYCLWYGIGRYHYRYYRHEPKAFREFSSMGANGFTIRYKERQIRFGGGNGPDLQVDLKVRKKKKIKSGNKRITIDEAEAFKKNYIFPSSASISVFANRNAIVSYDTHKNKPECDTARRG